FRLYRNRLFRVTNVISLLGLGGFIGVLFLLPLYLQDLVGVPASVSGLTTFPEALGVVTGSQIAGRLYPWVGPRRLIAGGLIWAMVCIASLAWLDEAPELWHVRIALFLAGMGMSFQFLPIQAASFATISSEDTGRAPALFSAQRQLAAALGVAVLASVLSAVASNAAKRAVDPATRLAAFHAAFLVAAGMAGAGALVALTVPDREAAGTMRSQARTAQ
ncbi:MAG: MFS transporter, partial [Chloroflexi bacterium]|nr:MFS transporter [Chloroflexota bacterium]